MVRACWGDPAPIVPDKRVTDAVQRHKAYIANLGRKAQEKAEQQRAEPQRGVPLHERERGFQVMFSGANQGLRPRMDLPVQRRTPLPPPPLLAPCVRRRWSLQPVHLLTAEGDVLRVSPKCKLLPALVPHERLREPYHWRPTRQPSPEALPTPCCSPAAAEASCGSVCGGVEHLVGEEVSARTPGFGECVREDSRAADGT